MQMQCSCAHNVSKASAAPDSEARKRKGVGQEEADTIDCQTERRQKSIPWCCKTDWAH